MQFSFESGFNGGRIAAKYHLSDQNALRAAVSFSARTEDSQGNVSDGGTLDEDDDFARSEVDVLFLRYPGALAGASFYFGAGPYLVYSERNYRRFESDFFGDGPQERRSEEQTIETGLVAVLGAEWFISRTFSLHMEYAMRAGRAWRESEESFTNQFEHETREFSTDIWRFDAGENVLFGLSFYF